MKKLFFILTILVTSLTVEAGRDSNRGWRSHGNLKKELTESTVIDNFSNDWTYTDNKSERVQDCNNFVNNTRKKIEDLRDVSIKCDKVFYAINLAKNSDFSWSDVGPLSLFVGELPASISRSHKLQVTAFCHPRPPGDLGLKIFHQNCLDIEWGKECGKKEITDQLNAIPATQYIPIGKCG